MLISVKIVSCGIFWTTFCRKQSYLLHLTKNVYPLGPRQQQCLPLSKLGAVEETNHDGTQSLLHGYYSFTTFSIR